MGERGAWQVLLLPPNVVGHARLLLLAAALGAGGGRPAAALALFALTIALDALDGWLARRLGAATCFGAAYDVAIDLATRAVLWGWGAAGPAAALPPVLEGLVFAATHAGGGAAWKTGGAFAGAPPWVTAIMAAEFRTVPGALAVAGLFGCPLWLFARRVLPPGSLLAADAWGWVVVPGRLLAAAVEAWVLARWCGEMLAQDAAALERRRTARQAARVRR